MWEIRRPRPAPQTFAIHPLAARDRRKLFPQPLFAVGVLGVSPGQGSACGGSFFTVWLAVVSRFPCASVALLGLDSPHGGQDTNHIYSTAFRQSVLQYPYLERLTVSSI